jgi:hypothetical protein
MTSMVQVRLQLICFYILKFLIFHGQLLYGQLRLRGSWLWIFILVVPSSEEVLKTVVISAGFSLNNFTSIACCV